MVFPDKEARQRFFRRLRRPSAKKSEPTNPETKEKLPSNMEIKDYKSGLLVEGWEGIQSVLEEYAKMDVPVDTSAVGQEMAEMWQDLKKYGKSAGETEYHPPTPYTSEEFIPYVMESLQAEQLGTRVWFGYTGNSFQKTHIAANPVSDSKKFILHIEHITPNHNIYDEGNSLEETLANKLKLEHVLHARDISIAQPHSGETLSVDMQSLAQKLSNLHLKSITAKDLFTHFFRRGRYDEPASGFILGSENAIGVAFNFQNVGQHYSWIDRDKKELWIQEDNTLLIPLTDRISTDKRQIGFSLRLFGDTPIISVDRKQMLADFTDCIVKQFGK